MKKPMVLTGADDTQGNFQQVVNVAALGNPAILTLVATDAAGNRTTRRLTLTRDTDAPVISITSPGVQASPAVTSVDEIPFPLTGTVVDAGLTGVSLNGQPVGAWEENQLFKPKRGGFEFEELSVKRKTDWWGYSVKLDFSLTLSDFYWVNRNWEVDVFLPLFKVDNAFLVDELPWAEGDSAYDIMSYIIPARSKALGAQGGLAGSDYEITDEVDMKAQYGLSKNRFDHSAQFFSTNIKRQFYWNRVIDVFGF